MTLLAKALVLVGFGEPLNQSDLIALLFMPVALLVSICWGVGGPDARVCVGGVIRGPQDCVIAGVVVV